ncbi:hypothetical protein KZ375_11090, partial [Glaesserella parasuis]|nr:hypothetical protein [Glaesserella parasuis]
FQRLSVKIVLSDIVCMGWLGFGELNYTKFLCRLFFVLKRSTRPMLTKIIYFLDITYLMP